MLCFGIEIIKSHKFISPEISIECRFDMALDQSIIVVFITASFFRFCLSLLCHLFHHQNHRKVKHNENARHVSELTQSLRPYKLYCNHSPAIQRLVHSKNKVYASQIEKIQKIHREGH